MNPVSREENSGELSYRQQLRLCTEHGMICLEYYRRHGLSRSTGKQQNLPDAIKRKPAATT